METTSLLDGEDIDILMHRDAHFSGQFSFMITYYEEEGKGVSPAFTLKRIKELASVEEQSGENLAGIYLSGPEADRIAQSREMYQSLRSVYEEEAHDTRPKLMADLILSEEEDPFQEIKAIVEEGEAMLPLLHELIGATTFYDPVFPGYGHAPQLAAKCLGEICHPDSIIPLFEAMDRYGFGMEEASIEALYRIGESAKTFLLQRISSRPFNTDNEKAAAALAHFKEDPSVAQEALKLLQDPELKNHELFGSFLLCIVSEMSALKTKDILVDLAKNGGFRGILKTELDMTIRKL